MRTENQETQMTPNENNVTDNPSQGKTTSSCPECSGNLVLNQPQNDLICDECSLTISKHDQKIDLGPEWRSSTDKHGNKKSRVGQKLTEKFHDRGLSTEIGYKNKDGYGNQLSSSQRRTANRLRTWQKRTRFKQGAERILAHGLGEISRMTTSLGLPDVVEESACELFKKAQSENILLGRSVECVASASVYIAAKQAKLPRTFKEILRVSRINTKREITARKQINQAHRQIIRHLNVEYEPSNPQEYLPRITSELEFVYQQKTENRTYNLLDEIQGKGRFSGHSPISLAAAALYLASKKEPSHLTQKQIAEAANVSKRTIQDTYKEIADEVGIMIPSAF